MWFESLVGFAEQHADQVRANLSVDGEIMTSAVNGRQFQIGRLETPSLTELRSRIQENPQPNGRLKLSEIVADVQQLHLAEENAGSLFQVASQFNLLEMVSPSVTPEDGVDRYECDRTQGPACAIACGAGTIYRNYFVSIDGNTGQTSDRQIDCLDELGIELGNSDCGLWSMQNGYALATAEGLSEISARLSQADETERDRLRQLLKIGIHWNTEVTIAPVSNSHTVSQVYGSALPVAYSIHSPQQWAPFARLVLEAAYEATLCAGVLNSVETKNNRVYLTLLGGGAFGNHEDWIFAAIDRALRKFAAFDLDVAIVSYGTSKPGIRQLVADYDH